MYIVARLDKEVYCTSLKHGIPAYYIKCLHTACKLPYPFKTLRGHHNSDTLPKSRGEVITFITDFHADRTTRSRYKSEKLCQHAKRWNPYWIK